MEAYMEGSKLTIKVKKEEQREENARYIHRERQSIEATRMVRLPLATASQDIDATLRDGVLTLEVRKDEKKLPRRIAIS